MAQNTNEAAIVGTVTAIVGEVTVTGADGVQRVLTAGDKVFAGEVVETSANGAVHIQLSNGRALECGPRFSLTLRQDLLDLPSGTRIALDGAVTGPVVATAPQQGEAATQTVVTPATNKALSPDIVALQAAIAGGADPSRVADATAAGGAPGAGGVDGGGGTPLLIEQANSRGDVSSGFVGGGSSPLPFPELTTQQFAVTQPEGPGTRPETPSTPPALPVISVDIPGIRLVPPPPGPDSTPETPPENVTVSGNIVSIIEGTSPGPDPGKILNFLLVLDKPSPTDVEVGYRITAIGFDNDTDLVDLLGGKVTIPAGSTQILVPIKISQDHDVEDDEAFELVITSATNATINPDASTAILRIINDDEPPLASDDAYTVSEGENGATLLPSVLSRVDAGESADDSGADAGEILTVTTVGTIATAEGGHVEMNADGTFRYFAPNADFNGTDSFSYKMTDGYNGESEAVVTITVSSVNDVPDAKDNIYSVDEDGTLVIPLPGVLGNDSVGGDGGTLTVTSFTQPANGTLTLNPDGSFSYTPNPNFNGLDSFTYTIEDIDGDSDTATVTITVNPVDETPEVNVPVAGGATTTVYESGLPARSGESAGSDDTADSETTSGVITFTSPDGLSVVSLGGHVLSNSAQTFSDGLTAYYTFDAASASGTIYYSYTLSDNTSGDSTSANFAVVVTDIDGDSSPPSNLVINIVDDTPTIGPADSLFASEAGNVVVADLNLVPGADSVSSLVITGETNEDGLVVDVAGNVLTSGGLSMTYMQSGGTLYAVTTPGNIDTAVFTVTPDRSAGTYSVRLLSSLDATKVVLSATFSGPDAGAPDDPYTVEFKDQTGSSTQISHLFGFGDLEVNPSRDGLGSGANVISEGDQVGVWLGTQLSSVNIALSKFASHGGNNVTSFSWTAFTIDPAAVVLADYEDVGANPDDGIYSLTEFFDSIYISGDDLMAVVDAGSAAVKIGSAVGGGDIIAPQGPAEESDIDTYTLDPSGVGTFDFIHIEQTDGSMKINGMSFETGSVTEDIRINLTATATDGDLDTSSDTFQVTFSGGGEGGYTLTGGDAAEALQGGSGNDILVGGGGSDTLSGAEGSDTFRFTDAASADIITDFEVGSSGDMLDVHDVLPVSVQGTPDSDALGVYLQVMPDGAGNTVIMLDADGAGSAPPVAIATLEGVTGVTLAGLLGAGQIKTDS